jgi:hypothetical protein
VTLVENRHFGAMCHPHHQDETISDLEKTLVLTSKSIFSLQLPVTANVVASSLIPLTLMMEVTCSSETLVLIRDTRRHIPEDDILYCNLFSAYTDNQNRYNGDRSEQGRLRRVFCNSAMQSVKIQPTFRNITSLPSSGSKNNLSN